MPYQVRLTPEAARQLQLAAAWWEANRPSAPTLFLAEMERVFVLLGREPGVGKPVEDEEFRRVRRVHASRVRYTSTTASTAQSSKSWPCGMRTGAKVRL